MYDLQIEVILLERYTLELLMNNFGPELLG